MGRKDNRGIFGFDVPATVEESYFFEISKVFARAANITRLKLAPLKIESRDYVAMAVLAPVEHAATQSRLVKDMGISPNVVLAMIDNLDHLGYTKRLQNPKNRRENVVLLTKEGRQVYDQAVLLVRQAEEELLAPLSVEEREQCLALTRKLYEQVPSKGPFILDCKLKFSL
jgi:DNA-binding MarR family transcriptional regulator